MKKELTIISKSQEIDAYTLYDLTESPAIMSLKNIADKDVICVGSWITYYTKDQSGNEITCVSIQDATTGEVFSGQSATFRESFTDIVDLVSSMEPKPDTFFIEVLHRTSKAGRGYINCALVPPDRALKRMGYTTDVPTPESEK
jgi:hypothetical protein